MTRLKRFTSIVVAIAGWGFLAYAAYAIAVPTIVYKRFADTLVSQSLVYADDSANIYIERQCLKDWLSRSPTASGKALREMTAGEARERRHLRLSCNAAPFGYDLLREMRKEAEKQSDLWRVQRFVSPA